MSYQTFVQQWDNKRIDYDRIYSYQCVDLIFQYLYQEFALNGVWGNAIDFWTNPNTFNKTLGKFDRIQTSQVQQGDIVILSGLTGNPYGHIGIATGEQDGGSFRMFEQNGYTGNGSGIGKDACNVFRSITKSRVQGVLRPKVAVVPPPAPASPKVHAGVVGKTLYLKPHVQKWRVYALNQQPIIGREIYYLSPAKYGGLSYRIERLAPFYQTVVIRTNDRGYVNIYVDGDAEIRG